MIRVDRNRSSNIELEYVGLRLDRMIRDIMVHI